MKRNSLSAEEWVFQMGKQIAFYEKNYIDLDNSNVVVTSNEGSEFLRSLRLRTLTSSWQTTESSDSVVTQIELSIGDVKEIDTIILIDHNLKNYTIEFFNEITEVWTLIKTVTNDLNFNSTHSLIRPIGSDEDYLFTSRVRLKIQATQSVNAQKRINRVVLTRKLGSFETWPEISNLVVDTGRTAKKSLSGKVALTQTVGAVRFTLKAKDLRSVSDIDLIERLYRQVEGFQVSLSGGDDSQFITRVTGYRAEDLYLMHFAKSYSPEFVKGVYINGLGLDLDLVEVLR